MPYTHSIVTSTVYHHVVNISKTQIKVNDLQSSGLIPEDDLLYKPEGPEV